MAKVPVYNAEGKKTRDVDFDESVFGEKVLGKTLREVVLSYGRNQRQGNAHSKVRSEVAGSNRKLWKQKGTGRARVGDRRPPHWRGGGVSFGPRSGEWHKPIPAGLRKAALKSALLSKFKDGEVRAVEGLSFSDGPKTKKVSKLLEGIGEKRSTLIALAGRDANFVKSVRNLKRVNIRELADLNAYDVVRHVNLVLPVETLDALKNGIGAARKGKE
ncbi:MAG: 50S ribosomal protein L4 [Planctomycetes bacterium]|nr:50S ribosomal protein L4 [Planctomycetota bacterium]NUQ35609.1 50S ribosomal protein L4 [Planctomycetaceae bacterium]